MQTDTHDSFLITDYLNCDLLLLIACCQRGSLLLKDYKFPTEDKDRLSLIYLAKRHGIIPLLYQNIKKLTPLHNEIKPYYKHIAHYNMLLSSELLYIIRLLTRYNIEVLVLKGPPLAQIAYGDITLRQYSDLDILVDVERVSQAGSILVEYGYTAHFPIALLENKTCLDAASDLTFQKKKNGVMVELHWKLFREKIAQNPPFASMHEKRDYITINSNQVPTLSTEMLLVYLCLHGAKHAWERMEWICDIDRLVSTQETIDWEKTLTLAKEMESHISLFLGLELSRLLFHTAIPENFSLKQPQKQIRHLVMQTLILLNSEILHKEGYTKYRAIHHYQRLLLESPVKRLKHFLFTYFAVSKNDCQTLLLPASLKFLYWFIKPFRVLIKYIQYGR